jgi:HEAT repeat protein
MKYAVLALALAAASSVSEEVPASRAAFDVAGPEARAKTMRQLLMHNEDFGTSDAIDLLRAGLVDADRNVRLQALGVVAGWNIAPGLLQANLAPSTRELRPLIVDLLRDPSPLVRKSAIYALGAIEGLDPEAPITATLSPKTVGEMASIYFGDPDGNVREAIMKALGKSSAPDSPVLRSALVAGLDDPSQGVRQYAMMGAERLQLREALPKLAKELRNPQPYIRFLAAKALSAYGPVPEYVEALESALEVETDPMPKAQIQRTLEKIRE